MLVLKVAAAIAVFAIALGLAAVNFSASAYFILGFVLIFLIPTAFKVVLLPIMLRLEQTRRFAPFYLLVLFPLFFILILYIDPKLPQPDVCSFSFCERNSPNPYIDPKLPQPDVCSFSFCERNSPNPSIRFDIPPPSGDIQEFSISLKPVNSSLAEFWTLEKYIITFPSNFGDSLRLQEYPGTRAPHSQIRAPLKLPRRHMPAVPIGWLSSEVVVEPPESGVADIGIVYVSGRNFMFCTPDKCAKVKLRLQGIPENSLLEIAGVSQDKIKSSTDLFKGEIRSLVVEPAFDQESATQGIRFTFLHPPFQIIRSLLLPFATVAGLGNGVLVLLGTIVSWLVSSIILPGVNDKIKTGFAKMLSGSKEPSQTIQPSVPEQPPSVPGQPPSVPGQPPSVPGQPPSVPGQPPSVPE
jgi:hypothetical protein